MRIGHFFKSKMHKNLFNLEICCVSCCTLHHLLGTQWIMTTLELAVILVDIALHSHSSVRKLIYYLESRQKSACLRTEEQLGLTPYKKRAFILKPPSSPQTSIVRSLNFSASQKGP